MMIAKRNLLVDVQAKRGDGGKEPFRLGNSGENTDGAVPQCFQDDLVVAAVNTVHDSFNPELRNRQGNRRVAINACCMGACESGFWFAPSAKRQQFFTGQPFGRIDGHKIHIPVKLPMLKAIIENEQVPEMLPLRQRVPPGMAPFSNHHGQRFQRAVSAS